MNAIHEYGQHLVEGRPVFYETRSTLPVKVMAIFGRSDRQTYLPEEIRTNR